MMRRGDKRLTNPLRRRPKFDMETLRRSALGEHQDEPRPMQEVALFEHSPRASVSPTAYAVDASRRRRPSSEIASAVSQALFVAITAALFVAWMATSH